MRIMRSFLPWLSFMCIALSSCGVNTTISATNLPTTSTTIVPAATFAMRAEITKTPTVIPTVIPLSSNKPGLIATLGEANLSGNHSIAVFSPNGQIIALASSRIRFWDVNTHQLIQELENPYSESCYVWNAIFSPDSKLFAISTTVCHEGNTSISIGHLLVWNLNTGKLVQEWSQEYAKMSPDKAGLDDYLIPVYAMAFLPDSSSIVFASGNTLEIRNVFQNDKHDVLKLGSKMYATQISMSTDGRLAYIIMSWGRDPGTVLNKFQAWNINTHAMLREIKYPEGWGNLSLELLGTLLVKIDFEKGTSQILNLKTDEVKDLPFRMGWRYYDTDGSLVIYARVVGFDDDEQAIELWKTDNERIIYTFMPDFGKDWTHFEGIVFSPDNTTLAIAHHGQVSLWNIRPIIQP